MSTAKIDRQRRTVALIDELRSERMTEHYSHVSAGEKNAAVTGMLRLVRNVEPAPEGQGEVESTGATETQRAPATSSEQRWP